MSNSITHFRFDFIENFNERTKSPVFLDIKLECNNLNQYSNLIPLFSNIPISDSLFYIESFLKDKYGGIENMNIHFTKGPEIDESPGGIILNSNEILIISELNDPEIYKISMFSLITLEFAHKLLESVSWFDLKSKSIIDESWIYGIKTWINKNEINILKLKFDEI